MIIKHSYVLSLLFFSPNLLAQSSCVTGQLALDPTNTSPYYSQVLLTISTSQCSSPQDFQNAKITFSSPTGLQTPTASFSFDQSSPLPFSYPTSPTNITSLGGTSTINLVFPSYSGATSVVAPNQQFKIIFGISSNQLKNTSVQVETSGGQTQSGSINLSLITPTGFKAASGLLPSFSLSANGNSTSYSAQSWKSPTTITSIPTGIYTVAATNVTGSDGKIYIATPNPASSLNIQNNQASSLSLTYSLQPSSQTGTLNLVTNLPANLPANIAAPVVSLAAEGGSSQAITCAWGKTVSQTLTAEVAYTPSAKSILAGSLTCNPAFDPKKITLSPNTTSTLNITWNCATSQAINVPLQVHNLTSQQQDSVKITFTDSQNNAITVNGSASSVPLIPGVTYNIKASTPSDGPSSVNISPSATINDASKVSKIVISYGGATCKMLNSK